MWSVENEVGVERKTNCLKINDYHLQTSLQGYAGGVVQIIQPITPLLTRRGKQRINS